MPSIVEKMETIQACVHRHSENRDICVGVKTLCMHRFLVVFCAFLHYLNASQLHTLLVQELGNM